MNLHKCPFPAVRTQFDSDHHQNRRLSSHSYSHESVIFFVFFEIIFVKLRRVCVFSVEMHAATLSRKQALRVRVSPLYFDRGPQVAHSG